MKRLAVLSALILVAALPVVADAAAPDLVAQLQQEQLAELNAARWNPAGWAQARAQEYDIDIDLTGMNSRPPLAVNADLTDSANYKANEVSVYGMGTGVPGEEHRSAIPPHLWPNELAILHGYDLGAALGIETNTIEAYYAGADIPVLAFLSAPSGPHRVLLMEWTDREEIGVGMSDEGFSWIFHLAYRDGAGPFVTGTVFEDLDGDGTMDAGEGLPGVTVTLGGSSAVTNGGGGYSIEAPAGTYTIAANGPGFAGTSTGTVTVSLYNVGADFIDGTFTPVIRAYELCDGREPTILGTSGNDVIYGTDEPDVIHGLDGNDVIYGLGGDDVICGGGGRNKIYGGGDDDRLIGGPRNDKLFGGSGADTLLGGRGKDKLVGGWGRDTLLGEGGRDTIKGNGSNDLLVGGRSVDYLDGGTQIDTCETGETLVSCES